MNRVHVCPNGLMVRKRTYRHIGLEKMGPGSHRGSTRGEGGGGGELGNRNCLRDGRQNYWDGVWGSSEKKIRYVGGTGRS